MKRETFTIPTSLERKSWWFAIFASWFAGLWFVGQLIRGVL